jgi:sugar lactone lactonase YvrE
MTARTHPSLIFPEVIFRISKPLLAHNLLHIGACRLFTAHRSWRHIHYRNLQFAIYNLQLARRGLMKGMVRIVSFALGLAMLLSMAGVSSAQAQQDERCFPETGFCISGRIREFWEQNGGLAAFGFPLGPQQQETLEGQAVQAQWFERVRLELHPENAKPYDVLLGRLGVDRLTQQGRDWFTFPKTEAQADCRFFPETGHNVCGAILAAWRASGLEFDGRRGYSEAENLALFGLPISDAQTEPIEGKDYSVQWFERGRFEVHPENQPPYGVLLGRLGAEVRSGSTRFVLPGNTVFPEGVAYQPSTGAYFVGSTTDGTIFRGTLRDPAASVFLAPGGDGRTTAIGLKIDSRGRLFVSGGGTGQMFVYDTANGALLGKVSNGLTPTFINDVAVTSAGDAYFTDSMNPILFKVAADANGQYTLESWLDFTGTALTYQTGFNLNGIAATPDDKYLIVVQSNTGKLFRIEIATKAVTEINLGGATVTNGDGILLNGQTLYVARNQQGLIVKIQLSDDLASGSVVSSTADPLLAYPTTLAWADGRLLVVNSQFNKRGPNLQPVLPFTITSIAAP